MASDELKPTHEQMMAGYEIACRFGVYESQAFGLAEAMFNAFALDSDAMRQRVELLERLLSTARDYVYSELEERKAAMAGYPHKWQQEEADLAEIDAALAKQPGLESPE